MRTALYFCIGLYFSLFSLALAEEDQIGPNGILDISNILNQDIVKASTSVFAIIGQKKIRFSNLGPDWVLCDGIKKGSELGAAELFYSEVTLDGIQCTGFIVDKDQETETQSSYIALSAGHCFPDGVNTPKNQYQGFFGFARKENGGEVPDYERVAVASIEVLESVYRPFNEHVINL